MDVVHNPDLLLGLCGSFRKLGVPCFGVLIIRILLFEYYMRVPFFGSFHVGPGKQLAKHKSLVIQIGVYCLRLRVMGISGSGPLARNAQAHKPQTPTLEALYTLNAIFLNRGTSTGTLSRLCCPSPSDTE